MIKKEVNTINDLIEYLKKYPLNTEISHLSGNSETIKVTSNLYVLETNPIGDRDSEDIITISFADNSDPFS